MATMGDRELVISSRPLVLPCEMRKVAYMSIYCGHTTRPIAGKDGHSVD
jgi:hypothetical protein